MTSVFPPHIHGSSVRGADIEINAWGFQFSAGVVIPVESVTHPTVPLEAVLLHELGHVLGLPDVCSAGSGPHRAPSEDGCVEHELGSVMFSPALREQLSPADVALLCATSGTSVLTRRKRRARHTRGHQHNSRGSSKVVARLRLYGCGLLVAGYLRLRVLVLARGRGQAL